MDIIWTRASAARPSSIIVCDVKGRIVADDKTFSHITVSTDDEDDFVIQAGAPAAPPRTAAEEPCREQTRAHEDLAESSASDGDSPTAKKPSRAGDGDYQETTLEDLKGSSMPAAQKAVLVAALLLVAVFVAYYLFLR